MGDKTSSNPTYGHFGPAIYDPTSKTWHFDRELKRSIKLQPLENIEIAIPGSGVELNSSRSVDGNEGPSRRRQNQAKALIKSHPELQPASGIIADLARVSEAIEDATNRHDPAKGHLLAFGSIPDHRKKESVTVAAFPCGPTGCDLRVVQVRTQWQGWNDSRDAWLEVPRIDGEEAIWKGPGVPIQSIVFSHPRGLTKIPFLDPSEYGDSYLAVRLITSTLLFRPRWTKRLASDSIVLDLSLVLELEIEDTGGSVHTDIIFNPQHYGNFVILDQAGSFSLWGLDGDDRDRWEPKFHGHLSDIHDESKKYVHDGWGRVIWVSDGTRIAVCNRRILKIFDASHETTVELHNVDVGLGSGIGWILDIATLPLDSSAFLVLTSTQVILQRLRTDDIGQPTLESLMNISHFRNAEDISLRLHIFLDENDIVVLIRSEISATIISHRLSISDDFKIIPSDATELMLPPNAEKALWNSRLLDTHFLPTLVEQRGKLPLGDCLARRCMLEDVRFYSMTTLHKNFAVQQALYLMCSGEIDFDVPPTSWEKKNASITSRALDDDFIVDDDVSDAENVEQEPQSSFIKRRAAQANSKLGDEWTVSYELSVQTLNEYEAAAATDMTEILEQAEGYLQQTDVDQTFSIKTLRELADGPISVRDVEDSELALRALQLLEPETPRVDKVDKIEGPGDEDEHDQPDNQGFHIHRLNLSAIPMPPITDLPNMQNMSLLSSTHDAITRNWTSNLGTNIPDNVKTRNHQLARSIAAEITLASQTLRLERPEVPQPSQSQSQSQSRSQTPLWDLPMRPPGTPSASRATPSTIYFDASSQIPSSVLPTPSRSVTPSAITASSPGPTSMAPEFGRLSRYTSFSKPAPPTLPRALNRVLSHWVPSSDPATYDWLSSSRQLSRWEQEQEADGAEMTQRERERVQRRADRYIRKQRREMEESRRLQVLSSQVPELVSASQPSRMAKVESQPTAVVGSSQTFGASQFPTSQVLPGRHGGRPAKKKRKSGF